MNTLCIVLLVSLTGYVRSVAVTEACDGTSNPAVDCDPDLYCETNVCKVKADMTCTATPDDHCITGATCVDTLCKCGADHTPNADMTMCLKKIEQVCTAADNDCVHGATCVDNAGSSTCTCDAATMVPKDDKSMCQLKIDQNCSTDPTMCMMGTSCQDQTCMCQEKSEPNTAKDKCSPNTILL
ncbi:fibropellin-3-like [Littorina saxatilis]|uniref:fibropellin-3-like n=1 Tax=Littorina saxatilis TaxID=31220 RepID=UPI0038B4E0DD